MADPKKQFAPPSKRWDGVPHELSPSLRIPPFDRDTKQWLGRADQEGKQRTQRFLQSLDTQTKGHCNQGSPPRAAKPAKAFVPMGDSSQGWNYSATCAAGKRATPTTSELQWLQQQEHQQQSTSVVQRSRPATAQQIGIERPAGMDGSIEGRRSAAALKHLGRQRAKDKNIEEALAAINQIHHRPHSAPVSHHRELQNLLKSTAKRQANLARAAGEPHNSQVSLLPFGKKSAPQEVSPEATTYQMAFNLAQDYPELYAQAIESTKSHPAPNKTLVSDWGDSLKQADDSEWRKEFYHSEYTRTNAEVHPHRSMTDEAKEHAFYKWMARQQLYYKDLLKDSARPVLETLLGDEPLEPKREAVHVLRQLMAVAQPEMYKSHSQAIHCPMGRAEEPELTNMTKERTKRLTMGAPVPRVTAGMYPTLESKMREKAAAMARAEGREPEVNEQQAEGQNGMKQRPWTADQVRPSFTGGNSVSKRPGPNRGAASARKPLTKDHFNKSTIPIKWAVSSGPISSAYIDAFGSPGVGGGRASFDAKESGSLTPPVRYKEVTCPIGAVNPHTAIAPFRDAYPVPECYVKPKEFPMGPGDATMQTQSRDSFGPHSAETIARVLQSAADANAQSRAALLRSGLPLGKGGFQTLHSKDWISEYDKKYQKNTANMIGDYAAAQRFKQVFGGPTASAGRLTLSVRPSGKLGSPKKVSPTGQSRHPHAFMPLASA